MIPSASFDLENKTGYDIFTYFTDYYQIEDPSIDPKILITASSTFLPLGEQNRESVETLIFNPEQGRWASTNETNAYVTIDFLKNKVNLVAYTLSTSYPSVALLP